MSEIDSEACYGIAPGHRMQWEEVQQGWVILYPEGMVKLNDSAAEILRRCDGATPLSQVVADLEQTFAENGLIDDVRELVAVAMDQGWVVRR
ncbi:MAG: pyrroloquinoline quinone biosynthesis peptide chaperone PqqD [Gammaproteobacteria bacterium]|nr:pyrroloquinoline quinone biosynthesis peptide chaperone PqqD [Gammaproteobacteria bacterium]